MFSVPCACYFLKFLSYTGFQHFTNILRKTSTPFIAYSTLQKNAPQKLVDQLLVVLLLVKVNLHHRVGFDVALATDLIKLNRR